jgi:FtsH-binding integral membrane protein
MEKKEYFIMSITLALTLIIVGCVYGLILSAFGFNVSITSWQYWVIFASLLLPAVAIISLKRNNIPLDSTLGTIIYLSSCSVTGFFSISYIQQTPISIWQFFVWTTTFIATAIVVKTVAALPWVQARMQSVKNYFSRK